MLEGVLGQGGVVDLDVELEVVHQVVFAQEGDDGGGVEVVLMLGGLHRLGLDEEGALEAVFTGIVPGHVQEAGQVIQLPFHVGVEQAHVAFAAAPEDVVLAVELDGGVEGILHLGAGAGDDVEVGIGGRAVHVAGMAEEVGRAPEQLDAGSIHLFPGIVGDGGQAALRLRQGAGLVDQIEIVKAEIGDADLGDELKGGVHLVFGALNGIRGAVPWELHGADAEGIAARIAEGMPVGDGEPEVLIHRLAAHHAVLVVILKGQRIVALRPLVGDAADAFEVFLVAGQRGAAVACHRFFFILCWE